MNGLDFDLRVLKPWARDPSFYATVFAEQSDVPEHEGPSASPPIDLYRFTYPLSKADQKSLGCLLGAVPRLLEQARRSDEHTSELQTLMRILYDSFYLKT